MGTKRVIHNVDVDTFALHIRKGAELLKDISPGNEEDVIEYAEYLFLRQALLGDKVSHTALYLLNPEKSERVQTILGIYDSALEAFEKSAPDLVGSIPAEVTEENVRRLFFALLGIDSHDAAFDFLEHMWQHISWKSPRNKISGSVFSLVFSALMAAKNKEDAFRLLKDAESLIDWGSSSQQPLMIATEAAMEIFSVFLSLGKYALAKRVITAMKPLVDYPSFLEGLEADTEKKSTSEISEIQEATAQEEVVKESPEEIPSEVSETQETSSLAVVSETMVASAAQEPKEMSIALEECADNPFVSMLLKNEEYTTPPNPEFPFSFELPVWRDADDLSVVLDGLNENLYEMLVTITKNDGVRCLHDIPITVGEFQEKFPRYSDEKWVRKITPITIKVKRALENPHTYQQKSRPIEHSDESESLKSNKPVEFKQRKQANFFPKKKKRRASR